MGLVHCGDRRRQDVEDRGVDWLLATQTHIVGADPQAQLRTVGAVLPRDQQLAVFRKATDAGVVGSRALARGRTFATAANDKLRLDF